MKTKITAFAILLLAGASASQAQSTAYAGITAELVTPIPNSNTSHMHFGTVASSGTSGTVDLEFADGLTLPAGSTTQNTAVFAVNGEGTSGFSIDMPAASIILTGSVSSTMTVDNFVATHLNDSDDVSALFFTVKYKTQAIAKSVLLAETDLPLN